MKAISSKINMHFRNISVINNNIEKLFLRCIIISFASMAFLYVLLLGNMVFNIVERRSLEKEALALSNEVGELELSYLSLSSGIDLALSHSLGFKETNTKFATRKSLGSLGRSE